MATATRYVWNKYSRTSTTGITTGSVWLSSDSQAKASTILSACHIVLAKTATYSSGSWTITGTKHVSANTLDETTKSSPLTYSAFTYPYLCIVSSSSTTTVDTGYIFMTSGSYWYLHAAGADLSTNERNAYIYAKSSTIYYAAATTTYTKGSTDYGYVSSSSSSTYPSDGVYGSYWYTYLGTDSFGIGTKATFTPSTPITGDTLTISFTPVSNTYGGTITYQYWYQTFTENEEAMSSGEAIYITDYDMTLLSETTGTSVALTVPDEAAYIVVVVFAVSDGLGWTASSGGYYKYAATYTYTAPTAPEEITAAGGTYEDMIFTDDTITVTWSASTDADDDLTGYIVQRSYNGGSYTTVYQGSALTCTDTAASTWTTVQYRVQAYDNQGLYSDYTYSDTYAVTANTAPSAPAAVTIPTSIYLDVQHTISWSASTDSEGDAVYYEVAVSYDGSTWETAETGLTGTSTTATITDASITQVQYRVRAYDTYGACSSWTYSSTRTVINNTSPTITVTADGAEISSGGDIGTYTDSAPDVTVTIYDADGDTVAVTITMGSTTLNSAEISGSGTVTVDFGDWQTVTNGTYTLTVTADDDTDTVTWTGTMTKDMSSCSITMTENVTTENTITGVVMSISGSIPDDATVVCLATADGSTWEDVTDYASEASLYAFSTTGKSFNFKLSIERGETTGYVSSVQGVLITEE